MKTVKFELIDGTRHIGTLINPRLIKCGNALFDLQEGLVKEFEILYKDPFFNTK